MNAYVHKNEGECMRMRVFMNKKKEKYNTIFKTETNLLPLYFEIHLTQFLYSFFYFSSSL